MTGKDETPFMRVLEVDEETIERLQEVAAIDRGQTEMALDAMGGNEDMFRKFGEQEGVSELPEFQELLELMRIRDQGAVNTEAARTKTQDTSNSRKQPEKKATSVQSSWSIAMKCFFAGFGIGIALGILFAPMRGEDARNNIKQRADDLADSTRDLVDQGRDRVRTTMSAIRGQADRFTGAAHEATGTDTGRTL